MGYKKKGNKMCKSAEACRNPHTGNRMLRLFRQSKIIFPFPVILFFSSAVFGAEIFDLNTALQNTYHACVGIDDELADLKKMAGINTAITAVGTATGASATIVGLVKSSKDKQIADLEKELQKLKEVTEGKNITVPNKTQVMEGMGEWFAENHDESKDLEDEIAKLNKQSKKLGNWRTGLVAGSAATNVAGAIIAGKNKVKEDLEEQIEDCKAQVANLNSSIMQARMNGEDVNEAQEIFNACREYNYVDITPINKRARGAMLSSAVGAATGIAGTVTSAMANTDKTRNDNTDAGKQKEKKLNTMANIFSGATTAASATATVFNATQISAIKKVATVAQKCTEVLK